jgi:hypothetical protein
MKQLVQKYVKDTKVEEQLFSTPEDEEKITW